MNTTLWQRMTAIAAFGIGLLIGCADTSEPATTTVADAALTSDHVITQDLAQLSSVGIPSAPVHGVFSVGWNQFVGPAIQPAGVIGKAFVVVGRDTLQAGVRPTGVDIGTVTLTYSGGSAALAKRSGPNGQVTYSTFDRGLRHPQSLPVNVPFVSGGTYTFDVSGAAAFPAGSFSITAPSSLIDITNASGDSVGLASDLAIAWTGGDAGGTVVVRVVPHLARRQLEQPIEGGRGPRGPRGGAGGMGSGQHQGSGPHHGPGPGGPLLPENAIVREVSNTGTITLTAAELQDLVSGTSATEIMVHVAQVREDVVAHDNRAYALLLKNSDRVVLTIR